MSEAVYQENILALAAREDGGGVLPAPTASIKKSNPLCGDEILLTAQIDDGRIIALAHRTTRLFVVPRGGGAFLAVAGRDKARRARVARFRGASAKNVLSQRNDGGGKKRRDNRQRIANVRAGYRASESPRLRVIAVLGGDGFGGFARARVGSIICVRAIRRATNCR